MNKLPFNASWLLLLIPIGFLVFVIGPEIQQTYDDYHQKEITHQANVQKLNSLKKRLTSLTTSERNKYVNLQSTVNITKLKLAKERYNYYKFGGMFIILILMFIGMFGSSYWVKRKKKSSKNKEIIFNYADPRTDPIGQNISWEATEGSGSNFMSEYLKKTRVGYKISSSNYVKVCAWAFFLVGLNQVVWSYVEYYQLNSNSLGFMKAGKMFFTSGGVFIIVGAFLLVLFTGMKAFIHVRKRKIIVGGQALNFNQLYALQVLEKFISGSSSSGGYFCYELNLVTNQGDRYNLLSHGDKMFLLSDMAKLSKILNLPVWNNGVV